MFKVNNKKTEQRHWRHWSFYIVHLNIFHTFFYIHFIAFARKFVGEEKHAIYNFNIKIHFLRNNWLYLRRLLSGLYQHREEIYVVVEVTSGKLYSC